MAWKKTRWILDGPGVLVALAALIQLVPVARTILPSPTTWTLRPR